MMSRAYYNEIDPNAAQWIRNLIAAEVAEEFIKACMNP